MMKFKMPWLEMSYGVMLGFVVTSVYLISSEIETTKNDLINLDVRLTNLTQSKDADLVVYGRLVEFKPIYRNNQIDYYILTVFRHQLHPEEKNIQQYVYINQATDNHFSEYIKDNYCLKFNVSKNKYPQLSYQLIDTVEAVQKYCE